MSQRPFAGRWNSPSRKKSRQRFFRNPPCISRATPRRKRVLKDGAGFRPATKFPARSGRSGTRYAESRVRERGAGAVTRRDCPAPVFKEISGRTGNTGKRWTTQCVAGVASWRRLKAVLQPPRRAAALQVRRTQPNFPDVPGKAPERSCNFTYAGVRRGRGAGFLHFPLLPCQKFLNVPPMDTAGKSCGLLLHVTEAGAHVQPPLVYAAPASLKKRTNHYV